MFLSRSYEEGGDDQTGKTKEMLNCYKAGKKKLERVLLLTYLQIWRGLRRRDLYVELRKRG